MGKSAAGSAASAAEWCGQRRLGPGGATGEPSPFGGTESLGLQHRGKPSGAGAAEPGLSLDGSRTNGIRSLSQKATRSALRTPRSGRNSPVHRAAKCGHAGKAGDGASAKDAHQDGLCLIVGVMSRQNDVGAEPARLCDEQAIARLPRPLLQPGRRLFTIPPERLCGAPRERA